MCFLSVTYYENTLDVLDIEKHKGKIKRQAAMRSKIKAPEIRPGESSNSSNCHFLQLWYFRWQQVENVNDLFTATVTPLVIFMYCVKDAVWFSEQYLESLLESLTSTPSVGLDMLWALKGVEKKEIWLWSLAKKAHLPTVRDKNCMDVAGISIIICFCSGTCLEAFLAATLTFSLLLLQQNSDFDVEKSTFSVPLFFSTHWDGSVTYPTTLCHTGSPQSRGVN